MRQKWSTKTKRVWLASPELRAELTAAHKPFWDAFRDRWIVPGESLAQIPRFVESLQSLVDQGYGLTDIGCMFGVSRERVRQWCGKFGVERDGSSGTAFRLWSPEQGRFVGLTNTEYRRRILGQRRRGVGMRQTFKMREKRKRAVAILRLLGIGNRRPPTLSSLLKVLEPDRPIEASMSVLLTSFNRRSGNKQGSPGFYRHAADTLFLMAGYQFRPLKAKRLRYIHLRWNKTEVSP